MVEWRGQAFNMEDNIQQLMLYALPLATASAPNATDILRQQYKCVFSDNVVDILNDFPNKNVLKQKFPRKPFEVVAQVRACTEKLPGWTRSTSQWFKLLKAWGMMEAHERKKKMQYEFVVRARFDVIALPRLHICRSYLDSAYQHKVFAMSDMVFC